MRDTLKEAGYFDAYIAREEKRLQKYQNWLDNNEKPEDTERIIRLVAGKNLVIESIISARYSRGDNLLEIRPLVKEYLTNTITIYESRNAVSAHDHILSALSFAVLFNVSGYSEKIAVLYPKKDGLLDFLSTAAKGKEKLLWDIFQPLWNAVLAESPEEQTKALTHYVEGWYNNALSKEQPWYNSYKRSSTDNMDRATYSGYWCWEAGAVAKLLHIPDENLKNHPNYPYDLVHFEATAGINSRDFQ